MDFEFNSFVIKKIYAVNKLRGETTRVITRKDRTIYSLAYKIGGSTVYMCDGKEYVSNRNHIVLLDKNTPYSFVCNEFGPCIMIEFDSDMPIGGFRSLFIRDTAEAETLFKKIARLWMLKNPGYEHACMSTLYEILFKIETSQNVNYMTAKQRKLIAPAIAYLEEHYADGDLTNDTLAAAAGISTVYFRKLFNAIYHMSPIKYASSLRMEKAKNLLLSDYNSVAYVASQVGFSEIYAFSRAFKKSTGMSPTEYKEHGER